MTILIALNFETASAGLSYILWMTHTQMHDEYFWVFLHVSTDN